MKSLVFPSFIVIALAACSQPANPGGGSLIGSTRESEYVAPQSVNNDVSATDKIAAPRAPHEMLFVAALHELDLTDAQRRTISDELTKLVGQAARVENPAPFALVAKSVRAGKIDATAIRASFEANRPKETAQNFSSSLTVLHDTLTAAQRQELVDALEKHHVAFAPPPDLAAMHDGFASPPMMRMLADLNLSDAQKDSLAKAFAAQKPSADEMKLHEAEMQQHHEEGKARLRSFVSETFDATAFMTPPASANGAHGGPPMSRMVDDLSIVVPVLSDDQREKLASKIEQGPISDPHAFEARVAP